MCAIMWEYVFHDSRISASRQHVMAVPVSRIFLFTADGVTYCVIKYMIVLDADVSSRSCFREAFCGRCGFREMLHGCSDFWEVVCGCSGFRDIFCGRSGFRRGIYIYIYIYMYICLSPGPLLLLLIRFSRISPT